MVVGGLLAAASFFVCAVLQIAVEQQDANAMALINGVQCPVEMTYTLGDERISRILDAENVTLIGRPWPEEITFTPQCQGSDIANITYKPSHSYKSASEKLIYLQTPTQVNISEVRKSREIAGIRFESLWSLSR